MVYFAIGLVIFLIGAIILDRFFLKPDLPVYVDTDEYKEELSDEVRKFQMEIKHLYIPKIFEVGPFEKVELIPQTVKLQVFGFNVVQNDRIIRKCILVRNEKEYEVWCKIFTKWGSFDKAVWVPELESLK